jgi:hypothetical protein
MHADFARQAAALLLLERLIKDDFRVSTVLLWYPQLPGEIKTDNEIDLP